MKIIPETTCRRCGKRFSAFRNNCPECGTRRVSQSVRTPDATPGTVKGTAAHERAQSNAKWQLIFGLILVVAVIVAVIVMVSTSLNGVDSGKPAKATPTPVQAQETPVVDTAPTPTPSPTPSVTSVSIRYVTTDYTNKDFTMHFSTNEEISLNAQVFPVTIENPLVTWTSSNPDVLQVTDNHDGTCTLKIIGTVGGGVTITATSYGVEAKVLVYCVN